jgi:hypothetical protein
MPLETAPFINGLVRTNPTGADAKSTSDDHHRVTKGAILDTFPAITGAVTATHTELSRVAGVTSAIQTQLDGKAALASPAFTGTPTAPTATSGTSSTQLATTQFVGSAIAGVNAQTALTVQVVSTTSQTAVAGAHYILTNVAATTVTLPATPASGDTVWVTWTNSLTTNVIARNGQTIMGLAENMDLDASTNNTVQLRFVSSSWRLI